MLESDSDPCRRSTSSIIRTPDQRVRVFVSSCLGELADERVAVRDSIQRLRLAPVMFELGARPHPPRALYRAYLDQSHIFVGIYAQSYGWVAPGETVSGIEDEYDAAGDRPKLMYVKAVAGPRDPRLETLLQRIERDDRASHKQFSSTAELSGLIEQDVSLLLSESFEASVTLPKWSSAPRVALPSLTTTFVGREKAIKDIRGLFTCRHARIVTLTGPGGIGKTRLALQVAHRMGARFKDGVVAVFLAPIVDPNEVVPEIAAALRLVETPGQTWLESVIDFLRERKLLLVLDNFEHLLTSAPVISEILSACPGVRALVTSREVLKIAGEHGYEVEPLEVPSSGVEMQALEAEAVRLFKERARAVSPSFTLDGNNIGAVSETCRRLEGVPLAIELAAARARVLPVHEIRARLADVLGFLVQGPRDAPERHRTLRATIAWSHALLGDCERRLFARLGVFRGGWSLEAASGVCECDGDVLDALSSLVDKSLVRSVAALDGPPRFTMLETVRQFAIEQLRATGEEEAVRARHAELFLAWVSRSADAYRANPRQQRDWTDHAAEDLENLRTAMRWFLDHGNPGAVAKMGMALWEFWFIRGGMREAATWMQEVLASDGLSERERAMAQFIDGLAAYAHADQTRAGDALSASWKTFCRLGDDRAALVAVPYCAYVALTGDKKQAHAIADAGLAAHRARGQEWQIGFSLLGVGRVLMLEGRIAEALTVQDEGAARLRNIGELMVRSLILLSLGWGNLLVGRAARAAEVLAEALDVLTSLRNEEGLARTIEAIGAVVLRRGDPQRGALMLGAAEGVRRGIGARPWALDGGLREQLTTDLQRVLGVERFHEAYREGAGFRIARAVDLARAAVQDVMSPAPRGAPQARLVGNPFPSASEPDRVLHPPVH